MYIIYIIIYVYFSSFTCFLHIKHAHTAHTNEIIFVTKDDVVIFCATVYVFLFYQKITHAHTRTHTLNNGQHRIDVAKELGRWINIYITSRAELFAMTLIIITPTRLHSNAVVVVA